MLRGYYTAASGIVTQQKKLNAYANNIANAGTVGYKKDDLIAGTFGEHLAVRMDSYRRDTREGIGPGVFMQTVDSEYTVHEQGALESTSHPMHMAIQGEGYFVINTPQGEVLSRDGQFSLDEEGYLVLPGFGRVQGEGGDIELGTGEFYVDRNGFILIPADEPDEEPEERDRLLIAIVDDVAALKKQENGFFVADSYTQAEENSPATALMQGVLEKSNVNMAEEMTRMIASQRGLQSASQIVKMYDEMAEQGNSRLSKV